MYGLPKDFDTKFLIDKRLELICVSENTVTFHFDRRLFFTIESAYSHQSHELSGVDQFNDVPVIDPTLVQLLGVATIDALASPDGTLVLIFENGHKLKFFDTSHQYESYRIDHDNTTVIV